MLALMEGRFEEAERLIAETLAVGQRAESWNAAVSHRLELFVLRRDQGRLAELEETIRRSVHEYPSLPRFPCALAHLYGELGRERDARAALRLMVSRDLAREYLDAEWLFTISLLADPCARLGDLEGAERLYSMLLPYESLYAQAPVEATFGAIARGLGVLATTLRRFDDAERHFDVAIEIERRMRRAPLARARPARSRGDAPRPRRERRLGAGTAALGRGAAGYRELGMDAWAARIEAPLRPELR